MAISLTNACYCVCGTVDQQDEFDKVVLSGFTQTELNWLRSTSEESFNVKNIHSEDKLALHRASEHSMRGLLFPTGNPIVSTLLYVPIHYGGIKTGAIAITNKIGAQEFSKHDAAMIETLSVYAGFAINNVQIYDQIAKREESLAKRNEDLALLNELAKISTSSPETQITIIEEAMRHVMEYLDIEVGEFFLRDEENPDQFTLVFKEGHIFQTSLFGFSSVHFGEGIVGKTAKNRQIIVLTPDEIDIINEKKATPVDLNYIVILPLLTQDGVVGVSCLGTKIIGDSEIFNLSFLRSITSWIATLIQDFRLNHERKRIAILEERERIGMDLHDGVIQSIYGVGLTLEHARILTETDPAQAGARIQTAIDAINATIRDIRSYIMNLKPARLSNENLIQSLRRLANDFHSNTFINTLFVPEVEDINSLSEESVNTFYLFCKEALSNITKHAKAQQVKVYFTEKSNDYTLSIIDDGCGFDLSKGRSASNHGITNMFTRAKKMGGDAAIQSQLGQGTTVTLSLPKLRKES